jgi:hypothetical protein
MNLITHFPTPTFNLVVYSGIFILAIVMSIAWTRYIMQHNSKLGKFAGICFASIALLSGWASYAGLLSSKDITPPLMVITDLILLLGIIGFSMSGQGLALARSLSWKALVGLQVFRFPLELVMLNAAMVDIMPREFSMLGYNFDVLSGLLSGLIFVYLLRIDRVPQTLLWAWNIFGLACLAVIGALAVLTSPNIHAFGDNSANVNTWILHFPYALLPLLLVNFAVLGHLLATRKLVSEFTVV